jgi:phosphate transport system substrate-binding protein
VRIGTAFIVVLAALGCAPRVHAQLITGAGSSFAAPVYGKWGEAAAAAGIGVTLNYQAIGSGGGQNQVFNRVVDFGASDAPVPADKLETNRVVQVPVVMGAVVVIVNLPGLADGAMKLTGPILSDIYQGKITKWNDPRIVAINPGLTLPKLAIAPVYRADGSGTTFVFTDYLSLVDPVWKDRVGSNTSVRWLAGSGARGSDGVAATVGNIKGGIGYLESAFAMQNHLAMVQIRNHDGAFISPTPESFAAAANAADWAKAENFAVDLNNEPGAGSWPILSATFVLIPADSQDKPRHDAVVKFFDWGLQHGDGIAGGLHYVVLPQAVKARVLQRLDQK